MPRHNQFIVLLWNVTLIYTVFHCTLRLSDYWWLCAWFEPQKLLESEMEIMGIYYESLRNSHHVPKNLHTIEEIKRPWHRNYHLLYFFRVLRHTLWCDFISLHLHLCFTLSVTISLNFNSSLRWCLYSSSRPIIQLTSFLLIQIWQNGENWGKICRHGMNC